jgi:hypothetical protein
MGQLAQRNSGDIESERNTKDGEGETVANHLQRLLIVTMMLLSACEVGELKSK